MTTPTPRLEQLEHPGTDFPYERHAPPYEGVIGKTPSNCSNCSKSGSDGDFSGSSPSPVNDLLDRCKALGISLWANGQKLGFDAPSGALTADLRAELVRYKSSLLALLRPAPTKPTKLPFDLSQRWGPGLEDDTPSIVIEHPSIERTVQALRDADRFDSYALAEREAIAGEADPY